MTNEMVFIGVSTTTEIKVDLVEIWVWSNALSKAEVERVNAFMVRAEKQWELRREMGRLKAQRALL